jgi:hypothetical protein
MSIHGSSGPAPLVGFRLWSGAQIRCIEIILSGNPDQSE